MKAQFLLTVGPYLQKAQFLLIVGSYFQKVQFFLIAGSNHPKAQFLLTVGSYFRGAFNKPTKEIDISSEGPTVMQRQLKTLAATLEQALHQVMHTASSQGDVRSSCRSNHSSAVGLDMPV